MPRIPLYNQGAGPTAGIAAGQLSPGMSISAATAPGRAYAGYQKTFSDVASVAEQFELSQQKMDADTLDTELMSRINEELSALDAEEPDDVNQVEIKANEIFDNVSKSIEDAPRINSRFKSAIKNKTASRFSSLTIPLKQNAVARKQKKQAESSIKGLNAVADNISRGTVDYDTGVSDANLIFDSMDESGANRFVDQTREEFLSSLDIRLISADTNATYKSVEDGSMPLSSALINFDVQRDQTKARMLPLEEEQKLLDAIDTAEEESKTIFYNDSVVKLTRNFESLNFLQVESLSDGLIQGNTDFSYTDKYNNEKVFSVDGLEDEQLIQLSGVVSELQNNRRLEIRQDIVGSLQQLSNDGKSAEFFEKLSSSMKLGEVVRETLSDGTQVVIDTAYLSETQQGELATISESFIENVDGIVLDNFGVGSIKALNSGELPAFMSNKPSNISDDEAEEAVASALYRQAQLLSNQIEQNPEQTPSLMNELLKIESALTNEIGGKRPLYLATANSNVATSANAALATISGIKTKQNQRIGKEAQESAVKAAMESDSGVLGLPEELAPADVKEKIANEYFISLRASEDLSDEDVLIESILYSAKNDVEDSVMKGSFVRAYTFGLDGGLEEGSTQLDEVRNALNNYEFLKNYPTVLTRHTTEEQRIFFDEVFSRLPYEASLEEALTNTRRTILDPQKDITIPADNLDATIDEVVRNANPAWFGDQTPINYIATKNKIKEIAMNRLEIGQGDVTSALKFAKEEIQNTHIWLEGSYQIKDQYNTKPWFSSGIGLVKDELINNMNEKSSGIVVIDPTLNLEKENLRIVKNEFNGNYIVVDENSTPIVGMVFDERGRDTGVRRVVTIQPDQIEAFAESEEKRLNGIRQEEIINRTQIEILKKQAYGPGGNRQLQVEYLSKIGRKPINLFEEPVELVQPDFPTGKREDLLSKEKLEEYNVPTMMEVNPYQPQGIPFSRQAQQGSGQKFGGMKFGGLKIGKSSEEDSQ